MQSIPVGLRAAWYIVMVIGIMVALRKGRREILGMAIVVIALFTSDVLHGLLHPGTTLDCLNGVTIVVGLAGALIYVKGFAVAVGHQSVEWRSLLSWGRSPRRPKA